MTWLSQRRNSGRRHMRERPAPEKPDEGTAPEPTQALAALVEKLRGELSGVRTAMRNRAVIEQAKGVLVERLGVSPDDSFDQLVKISQRANIKLIEVAATIVGTTAPDPTGTVDAELRDHLARTAARPATAPPRATSTTRRGAGRTARPGEPAPTAAGRRTRSPAHEALQAQHQLISSRIAASNSFDEVAEAIGATATTWPAPATVVLTLLEPDGAHRFVGA